MNTFSNGNWIGMGVGAVAGGGVAFLIGKHCELETMPLVGVTVGGAVAGGAAGCLIGGVIDSHHQETKCVSTAETVNMQPIISEGADIPDDIL